MGAFAQLERALIRDRQREGIEAAKARGVYRGRGRRLTAEQVQAARAEISAGVPKAVVARSLGVARQTLYDALARTGEASIPGEEEPPESRAQAAKRVNILKVQAA